MEVSIVERVISVALMIIAGYGGWLTAKATFRKQIAEAHSGEADAADKISAAWERLNKPQMERISVLEQKVAAQEKKMITQEQKMLALRRWAAALVEQVKGAGLTPVAFEDYEEGER